MFYKISNIATKESIEERFHVRFDFPNLYKPQGVIDGMKESTISVITISDPDKAVYAIWGLLPENFEDNWSVFQNVVNTLNVKMETLENNNGLYSNLLQDRRCVIVATGFFTTWITNGTVERCHVHLPNYEPFAIAGVYNELSDGFITCSLLVTKINESLKDIPNISNLKPLVLTDEELEQWFDTTTSLDDIKALCNDHNLLSFEYDVFESKNSIIDSKP
ncbi:SOS response-associated peptidase family protein [Gelidibacter maritimus]|uniref:Abasic site processing protein n=1 Tax=Gelidibacter maritimus TaxID=2761487 RepID=A0A7W2M4L8_9FLAO|nr:SOS response-associated peptidase family protein [Gelidibacter maritimus]MBA6152634.1 SOS response-associated peptidase family protein [Gelidibacter maritimus]